MTDTILLHISVMYYMCNVKVENKQINYKKKKGIDAFLLHTIKNLTRATQSVAYPLA